MSDDLQINVTKLATDGSNWVTYRDRMIWAINSCRWSEHLIHPTVPPSYITAGDINGLTPAQRWEAGSLSQAIYCGIGTRPRFQLHQNQTKRYGGLDGSGGHLPV
jgi:hypothetical protein